MTGAWPRQALPISLILGFLLTLGFYPSTSTADIHLAAANGESLTLKQPANRIITLAPNLAELVFAAGAGEHLQAVVEYSNYPPQVTKLPKLGDAFRIDLERITEIKPDLILAWKSGNPQTALQKLSQLGFKVWQIEIDRPEQIAEVMEAIARATGNEAQGLPNAAKFRSRLLRLRQENEYKSRLDYFFQISARPLYTINAQHIISRSLAICGVHNIFSDLASLAPQVSRESVIVKNPQVMIATKVEGVPPSLDVWQDWPALQAVKNKAMFYLPADEISQATPRLLDSIELACKHLDEIRLTTEYMEEQ